MNNGFSNLSTPSLNGLIEIKTDLITSSTTSTSQLFINGVDVSDEVQNNKQKIIALQQITTGITYSDTGASDLTTIDNNLTITSGKVLTVNGVDITSSLTGITYSNVGSADLTTIDNNVKIAKDVGADQFTVSTNGTFVNPVFGDKAGFIAYNDAANSFIIQNQETSGTMQFRALDSINALKVVLDIYQVVFLILLLQQTQQ